MRKLLLLMFATIFGFSNVQAQTDVTPVVGVYTGELYVALMEELYDDDTRLEDPVSVILSTSSTEGKVDFLLPNFTFSGLLLGDIALPNIDLNKGEDRYTFGENDAVRFNFLDGEIIADASLESVRSYVKEDSLVAYIPVIWISEGTEIPIYVLFKGAYDKVAGIANVEVATPTEVTTVRRATGVYDLAGRRIANSVSETTPRGLYIVDGHKVFVR